MLSPRLERPPEIGKPLTHRECILAGHSNCADHPGSRKLHVQLRRRDRNGDYSLCGTLVLLQVGNKEWFKVDTEVDTFWAEGRDLRLCSGDGRCTCELPRHSAAAGAEQPPVGLHVPVRTGEPTFHRRIPLQEICVQP
jgi:hypothetical protein